MEKKSNTEWLLAVALIAGAAYFLFYTETGKQWLERLKDLAADQLDQWLADLEAHLMEMESAESGPAPDIETA